MSLLEYNAATLHYRISSQMPEDSAKTAVIRQYIFDKRMTDSARALGMNRNPDSLVDRGRNAKQWLRWMKPARAFGVPVRDEKTLSVACSKYYNQYFAPNEKVTLAIIGSSDSAYIDSLGKVFSAWEKSGFSGKKKGKPLLKEPSLPWTYSKPTDCQLKSHP